MKFLFYILITTIFLSSAYSNRKGNGGIGVKCHEDIYLLEEFELINENKEFKEIKSFFDIEHKFIENLFHLKDDQREEVLSHYKSAKNLIGFPESWKIGHINRTYDSYYYNKIPPHCNLIQLASREESQVTLNIHYQSLLSERQKQMLWQHEILFYIAETEYKHTNSFLVRKIVKKSVLKEKTKKKDFRKIMNSFIFNFVDHPIFALRDIKNWAVDRTYELQSRWIRVGSKDENYNRCPIIFSMDYNGEEGLVLSLLYKDYDIKVGQVQKQKKGEYYLKSFNLNFSKKRSVVYSTSSKNFKFWYRKKRGRIIFEQFHKATKMTTVMIIAPSGFEKNIVNVAIHDFYEKDKFEPLSSEGNYSGWSIQFGPSHWLADVWNRGQSCRYKMTHEQNGVFFLNNFIDN